MSCVICLEDTIKVRGKIDCCEHLFCYDCILKWSKKANNKCPVCQRRFQHVEEKPVDPSAKLVTMRM